MQAADPSYSDDESAKAARILVIAVGNRYRGDDAAGLFVGDTLRERKLSGVEVVETSGEGAALMELWQDADAVYLVDAVSSNDDPGTVYRIDARREPLPTEFFHYSTHAFSVAEAAELARVLDQLPLHLIVYGIAGSDFSTGRTLSPHVKNAAERVVDRLVAEIAGCVSTSLIEPAAFS